MSDASEWGRRAVAAVDGRCDGEPLDRSLRITVNFHPDRTAGRGVGGVGVLEALADSGVYRSQFETGTSNGGLTAHPGGDRWLWERALFDGAYDDAPAAVRPKYGALDHRRRPLGGAPRFGSAHLRLREHMLDRATFCFPDSAFSPANFATAHHFDLLPFADAHDLALQLDPDDEDHDPLDGYVEAQIHGPLTVADVEAVVLDPCYRGTVIEEQADRLTVAVEWHEGRVLDRATLDAHEEYRGPAAVQVGHHIAEHDDRDTIDAAVIGRAVRSGDGDPQTLKQLWHLTAQWGHPRP